MFVSGWQPPAFICALPLWGFSLWQQRERGSSSCSEVFISSVSFFFCCSLFPPWANTKGLIWRCTGVPPLGVTRPGVSPPALTRPGPFRGVRTPTGEDWSKPWSESPHSGDAEGGISQQRLSPAGEAEPAPKAALGAAGPGTTTPSTHPGRGTPRRPNPLRLRAAGRARRRRGGWIRALLGRPDRGLPWGAGNARSVAECRRRALGPVS